MTSFGAKFVDALVIKTIGLGVAFAALGWLVFSARFAAAVLLGMMVSAFNLRVVGWVSRKMVAAAKAERTASGVWTAILLVKLFLLFALTYVFLVIVRADIFGYVLGFSAFLPAILWQAVSATRADAPEPMNDGDTESL